MVNTPGIGGKNSLFPDWLMTLGYIELKLLLKKAIFNIERDRPGCWFLEKKERLTALHPDMSATIAHKRILRKCGQDLAHSIRSRFIEPFSTEDYINGMEDITTRKEISRNWYKSPIENKTSGKLISRPNKPQDRAPFKCYKCGIISHLANTFPNKPKESKI
ncbi:hypothetical protein O181_047819 [Austropuccinia psidii MF-1]|uniref:Uncharacterized protein n=1 Tax=Austropuccinia psidii MF-1 TaxID=1389203 RepID=A0A9Q3HME6_9BASI|nr:hypothetical protein [Austropuccinia psidii MF-1]